VTAGDWAGRRAGSRRSRDSGLAIVTYCRRAEMRKDRGFGGNCAVGLQAAIRTSPACYCCQSPLQAVVPVPQYTTRPEQGAPYVQVGLAVEYVIE
jgi:hypothetical protein